MKRYHGFFGEHLTPLVVPVRKEAKILLASNQDSEVAFVPRRAGDNPSPPRSDEWCLCPTIENLSASMVAARGAQPGFPHLNCLKVAFTYRRCCAGEGRWHDLNWIRFEVCLSGRKCPAPKMPVDVYVDKLDQYGNVTPVVLQSSTFSTTTPCIPIEIPIDLDRRYCGDSGFIANTEPVTIVFFICGLPLSCVGATLTIRRWLGSEMYSYLPGCWEKVWGDPIEDKSKTDPTDRPLSTTIVCVNCKVEDIPIKEENMPIKGGKRR
jgi:hypothetical protein